MTKKERLDAYVQKKKGLTSLNKAQSLIMQGFVFILLQLTVLKIRINLLLLMEIFLFRMEQTAMA